MVVVGGGPVVAVEHEVNAVCPDAVGESNGSEQTQPELQNVVFAQTNKSPAGILYHVQLPQAAVVVVLVVVVVVDVVGTEVVVVPVPVVVVVELVEVVVGAAVVVVVVGAGVVLPESNGAGETHMEHAALSGFGC